MNIYARIRKIEDSAEFKRLVDALLGSEYGDEYQSVKEWHDFGVDGYQRKKCIVYAFYCPRYPERTELKQYKKKIADDIEKLQNSLEENKIPLVVKEWIFVTPDDLPMEIISFIREQTEKTGWESGTLTAEVLAVYFTKHNKIHIDFPNITAGLQFDKIPSIDVRYAWNRRCLMLELFNDGTEDIRNMEVHISEDGQSWRFVTNSFLFEFDHVRGFGHSLFNLRKGERQYCNGVPTHGGFYYKVSGIGVESNKTLVKEGHIK